MEYRYRSRLSSVASEALNYIDPKYLWLASTVITVVTPILVIRLARKMSEFHASHARHVNAMAFTMYVLMIIFGRQMISNVMASFQNRVDLFIVLHKLVNQGTFIAMLASYISLSEHEIRSRLTSALNHPPPGALEELKESQRDSKKSK